MNKNNFTKKLKKKLKLPLSKLENKLILSFYKNTKTKKLLKNNYDFGKTYELYIAWLFNNKKSNYDDYIIKTENNNKLNQANDGIDIIYPYRKKIYIIQVKSNNQNPNPSKLEKRSKEFLMELQNSNMSSENISKKWKISKKIIEEMKNEKDSFQVKELWITPNGSTKKNKIQNYRTEHWGIFQIINIRNIKNPENLKISKKYGFKITSNFSNEKHKAIIKNNNGEIHSLIIPLQIIQFYDFIKKKINNENAKIDNLFPGNVRYYQGKNKIKKSIMKTLKENPEDFYKYNNGITSISKKIYWNKESETGITNHFKIIGVNIINGQQTTIAIFNACEELLENNEKISNKAYVLFKVFSKLKPKQIQKLAMSTNQQKIIKPSELISTWPFNSILQEELMNRGIFYKPKLGQNKFTKQYKSWPKVELKNVLKYWYIKEEGDIWVKNKINTLMETISLPELVSKNTYEKYKNISDKFEEMNKNKKVETFKEIANACVDIKEYKSKKDKTFKIKQSLDMYSYFLLTDREKAKSKPKYC